ncbi:MAG: hypothetical protein HYX26_02695 [Acidobacteriales bacterium]|nr:hypothetical protein [Terriglobales bacterium]
MKKLLPLFLSCFAFSWIAFAASPPYIFVWAGDDKQTASDFLAVIDADPASPHYGQVVTSIAAPGPYGMPHHTEATMPADGFLLANSFETGKTTVFDLRKPARPKVAAQFGDLDGYRAPHTYVRLPNGNILAAFQYHGGKNVPGPHHHGPASSSDSHAPDPDTAEGGGLVEFTERGRFVRAVSAMDPAMRGELIRPYSLVLLPGLDRIVSTNTNMKGNGKTRVVQIWRMSDLKLMRSLLVPGGADDTAHFYPGEPILAGDGKKVYIHTFSCGLYALTGVETNTPSVRQVNVFPGKECGVPWRLGQYWVQTLSTEHALVALDLADPAGPREVSRITFGDKTKPHWISPDASGARLVMDSGERGDHRVYLIDFDPATGTLKLDERFRDKGSDRPGVSLDGKSWPHGFKGDAFPHGAVFSK